MYRDGETPHDAQNSPLNQRNIVTFVNNFLITSCNFLNNFALQCETKFITLERKLQKIEATLIILESKLASIPCQKEEYSSIGLETCKSSTEED